MNNDDNDEYLKRRVDEELASQGEDESSIQEKERSALIILLINIADKINTSFQKLVKLLNIDFLYDVEE